MSSPDQSKGSRSRDEVLAGEYVLGVLSLEDRQKVEARMRSDRSFAAIVTRWEENLSSFSDEYPSLKPPAQVTPKVEKRVFGGRKRSFAIWNSLPLWRSTAFAALFLAAGVIYFSVSGAKIDLFGKPLVAELAAPNSVINLVAKYDRSTGRLQVAPVGETQPEKKSLQLWLINGTDAPVSLGVLPQSGEGAFAVPSDLRKQIGAGTTIAVSAEPLGGSTTGAPTGAIIASGTTRGL